MSRSAPLPLGVLISGAGTNLDNLLRRCAEGSLKAEVRVVISNWPEAPGCAFSRSRGVPTLVIARGDYPSREAQHRAIAEALTDHGVDLVVLAGFDQILSDDLVRRFSFRILNLHPSLLPVFAGMHAVRDALDWGVKVTGCSVHFVGSEFPAVDSGPIIAQEAVSVQEDDTEEGLLARIHEAEYRLLPAVIQLYAEGRLRIEGRRVRVLP